MNGNTIFRPLRRLGPFLGLQKAESNELLDELVPGQGHFLERLVKSLRSPLTIMMHPINALKEFARDGNDEYLASIAEMIDDQMTTVIGRLDLVQDMAAVSAGLIDIHKAEGDLQPIIQEAICNHAAWMSSKRMLCQPLYPVRPIGIAFDSAKMAFVISRLMERVMHEADNGSELRVIYGRDNGMAALQLIWKPGKSTLAKGLPEELAQQFAWELVEAIIGRHEGELTVTVLENGFRQIMMRLPFDEGMRQPAPGKHAPNNGKSQSSLLPVRSFDEQEDLQVAEDESEDFPKVLIIEQHADLRHYLASCLEGRFVVLEAEHGQEGLDLAHADMPDLIISDVMMPQLDGHALCRLIKEDPVLNHIPVILMTSLRGTEQRVQALQSGADGYLQKPFDGRLLRAQVQTLLRNHRYLRERYSRQITIEPAGIVVPSEHEVFLTTIRQVVERHLEAPNFTMDKFADELYMGVRQLQRKFRAILNMTPLEYVRMYRLKRAAQLLEQRVGPIAQIAYSVGYNNPRHFSRSFSQAYGMSPREYRDKHSG